jgi:hypothetical protein
MRMKMNNEVTEKELLDKYIMQSEGTKITSWSRFITFRVGTAEFTGNLCWDSDDGYSMYWHTYVPSEFLRPEFEYVLDCITNGKRIPEYGDLSDAGMDGA